MGDVRRDWFTAARLFDGGYPTGLTSALRTIPSLRVDLKARIAAMGARRVLEVGPGDVPLVDDVPGAVLLDVAATFLRGRPRAVVGNLLAAPFRDGAFDLVVAADVLTHILPENRTGALDALARLGRQVLLFNPEPGTPEVAASPVPTEPLVAFFTLLGWKVSLRRFLAHADGGGFPMAIVTATAQ